MEDLNKIIGNNLKEIRLKHKETQEQLALVIGYNKTTVANYESGYRLMDLLNAYKIAKHYGVSLDDFFKGVHESWIQGKY